MRKQAAVSVATAIQQIVKNSLNKRTKIKTKEGKHNSVNTCTSTTKCLFKHANVSENTTKMSQIQKKNYRKN